MENSLTRTWRSLPNWQRQTLLIIALILWSVASLILAVQFKEFIFFILYSLGLLGGLSLNVMTIIDGVMLYALMLGVLIGGPWMTMRWRTGRKILGFDRLPQWIDIGVALAGLVLYFVVAGIVLGLIEQYVPQVDLNQSQNTGISTPFGIELLLVFILYVVIGPIVEELIFRGYLYGTLRKNGVSIILATVIVSILFGAAHGQWNVGINVGILSVMMCIGREVTGSIWPSILMHMVKNYIAYYLLFVAQIPGIS